ncbi:MAG: dihydroneopterin aldolase [Gammaproteobacteria bacterium]
MRNPVSSIVLHGLEVSVHLGWPQAERLQEQTVLVDIKIRLHDLPLACSTDQLDDTFCYDKLVSAIKTHVSQDEFRLLERLGHEIYQIVKESIQNKGFVSIRLNKKPPIANLTGGVSFCYGDEDCAW